MILARVTDSRQFAISPVMLWSRRRPASLAERSHWASFERQCEASDLLSIPTCQIAPTMRACPDFVNPNTAGFERPFHCHQEITHQINALGVTGRGADVTGVSGSIPFLDGRAVPNSYPGPAAPNGADARLAQEQIILVAYKRPVIRTDASDSAPFWGPPRGCLLRALLSIKGIFGKPLRLPIRFRQNDRAQRLQCRVVFDHG